MKKYYLLFLSCLAALFLNAQKKSPISIPDSTKKMMVVEAACGECQFHLAGKSCDLAVRINGKAYFVDGTSIDEHGNAHAKDGFCNAVSKAEVQGEIVNERFKATYFRLVKTATSKKP